MTIELLVFQIFASIALASAVTLVLSTNPVKSVLFLILAFFAMAGIWLMAHAEFLALVLVLVYVGAVMTLFLFIVMMLTTRSNQFRPHLMRYLGLGVLVLAGFLGIMIFALSKVELGLAQDSTVTELMANNTKAIGLVLYSEYLLPFEVAGVLLLVAIIASIALVFRGPQSRRVQDISSQIRVTKQDRLRFAKFNKPSGES